MKITLIEIAMYIFENYWRH